MGKKIKVYTCTGISLSLKKKRKEKKIPPYVMDESAGHWFK